MRSPRQNLTRLMSILAAFALVLTAAPLAAQQGAEVWPEEPPAEAPDHWGPVSPDLEEIEYPYPVHYLELNRFGQDMRMAYMDVPAAGTPNGQTVVIFHGMNFYGEAYTPTINVFREAGFRVVALDQIGFGKSTKAIVPYTFSFLAANSKAVLDELGIERVAVLGHSMGGILAARFAMHYPEMTTHVVLANQIGLTDSRQRRDWNDPGDGYDGPIDRDRAYQSALRSMMNYYPDDQWYPPQLEYVRRIFGFYFSGDYPQYAKVRSLLSHMLYSDPIVYDWQHIATKTLVIGGEEDELSEDWAAEARNSAEQLQNAAIILYPGIGHNPQQSIPDQFHGDVIRFLRSDPNVPAERFE